MLRPRLRPRNTPQFGVEENLLNDSWLAAGRVFLNNPSGRPASGGQKGGWLATRSLPQLTTKSIHQRGVGGQKKVAGWLTAAGWTPPPEGWGALRHKTSPGCWVAQLRGRGKSSASGKTLQPEHQHLMRNMPPPAKKNAYKQLTG